MCKEGLYAFWRASKLFGHPFGHLAEWEVGLLAIRSEGVSGEGWVHYLHGAMAVRGLEPAPTAKLRGRSVNAGGRGNQKAHLYLES